MSQTDFQVCKIQVLVLKNGSSISQSPAHKPVNLESWEIVQEQPRKCEGIKNTCKELAGWQKEVDKTGLARKFKA